jgi:2-(1,2-epoxy-1,2-dihydrophenyl)acetyl-CoA isomerase
VITLNRPERLNALTVEMADALLAALDAAQADPECRALLLTGAGRAFCAGQDLNAIVDLPPDAIGGLLDHYNPLIRRIRDLPMPVICAVNGVAAGAGANLALCCDLVIARRSASFIQAFAKIGLVPDCGGTWLLPRLVGRARALGLAMLGDKLGAEDAERFGLIWKCVDDGVFESEVRAVAQRLAAMPTRALAATRAAIDASQQLDFAAALSHEAEWQTELGGAHDYLEGVAAFMAKRPPVFSDR